MSFFDRFRRSRGASQASPAAAVPTVDNTPKVKPGQAVIPSHLTTDKPSKTSILPRSDRGLINTDITTYRTGATTRETIRNFVKSAPDLSGAAAAYARTAITKEYTAVARNIDGTINPEATSALHQLLTRLNTLNDYTIGYDDSPSIRSLAETWVRELIIEGSIAGELVLDKARLPYKIQPVSTGQIVFYPSADGKKLIPKQRVSNTEINLDVATFFMVSLDQDVTVTYSESPIESALQPVLFGASFMNDVRRVVSRAIHPRQVATIDEEKFRKNVPPNVQGDVEKTEEFFAGQVQSLADTLADTPPEQPIVLMDSISLDVIDHGNTNLSNEYTVVREMINEKTATGAKVMPTVLGHSGGTSNTASTETLLFIKSVEGGAWAKLNEIFSKILTLGVRLYGYDVSVDFSFDPIDLRPDSELEAFRSMRQSRVLEQLSLGFITDEEAAIRLTGHLPPKGFKSLSGTGFRPNTSSEPAGNGYNGASNSGSTLNQNLNSDAPKNPKSQNGGKNGAEVLPIRG